MMMMTEMAISCQTDITLASYKVNIFAHNHYTVTEDNLGSCLYESSTVHQTNL
jgi:hypothetical protein